MTTAPPVPNPHHGDLPARDIAVRPTGRADRPVALCLGIEGRDGRAGGAAHGVLLTRDHAEALIDELADHLGLIVLSPAPFMPKR